MMRNSHSHEFCETDYRAYHVSGKYNCTDVHSKQRLQTRFKFLLELLYYEKLSNFHQEEM